MTKDNKRTPVKNNYSYLSFGVSFLKYSVLWQFGYFFLLVFQTSFIGASIVSSNLLNTATNAIVHIPILYILYFLPSDSGGKECWSYIPNCGSSITIFYFLLPVLFIIYNLFVKRKEALGNVLMAILIAMGILIGELLIFQLMWFSSFAYRSGLLASLFILGTPITLIVLTLRAVILLINKK